MATTIDWATGEITVPKADLTLITVSPYEIRELDSNAWRLILRDLEDDIDGRPWPRTHDHNKDVDIGGGVILADVLLILAPYTITFEDGLYAVNLVGTNNNILLKNNKNQVSVNPGNTAGLIRVETGSVITEQDKLDIADRVWDEILTGATHNIAASSGRRLRALGDIVTGEVDDVGATADSFISDLGESRDNFYDDQLIRFTSGNLIGYVRPILTYNGTSKRITVSETMIEAPDNGSEFDIIPTHVHPISQITDAVWDEAAGDHVTPGTTGEQAEDTLKKAKLAAFKL